MGKEKKNTISFRKGLVVLQFGLSILLIVVAIIVKQQVNFINQKDLGLEKNHVISIHQDQKLTDKYEVLIQRIDCFKWHCRCYFGRPLSSFRYGGFYKRC